MTKPDLIYLGGASDRVHSPAGRNLSAWVWRRHVQRRHRRCAAGRQCRVMLAQSGRRPLATRLWRSGRRRASTPRWFGATRTRRQASTSSTLTLLSVGSPITAQGPPPACSGRRIWTSTPFRAAKLLHISGITLAVSEPLRAAAFAAAEAAPSVSLDTNLRLKLWPVEEAPHGSRTRDAGRRPRRHLD